MDTKVEITQETLSMIQEGYKRQRDSQLSEATDAYNWRVLEIQQIYQEQLENVRKLADENGLKFVRS